MGIGGRSDQFLNQIIIKYINNYTPSVQVEESTAIIGIVSHCTSIDRFTSNQVQTIVGATKVMELVFTGEVGGESGAIAKYIAKLTAKFGFKRTTRDEIRNEVTAIELNSLKTTFTPGPNRVGLEMVPVQVFKDTEFFWIWPVGMPTMLSFAEDADRINGNAYDLTGLLQFQMPGVQPRLEQRNGYNFYKED